MPSIFDKLNLKAQTEILVLNAPPSFTPALEALDGVKVLRKATTKTRVSFAMGFALTHAELDRTSRDLIAASDAGDVIIWIAYAKGTSNRYTSEFNRDSGWIVLKDAGFDTVRQVAIDDDWSALRFRRSAHIKNTTKA
jgi:hypothetical protein